MTSLEILPNIYSPKNYQNNQSIKERNEVILDFPRYITPATLFGKLLLFTLFNTTAPTATCPVYGSPLASA